MSTTIFSSSRQGNIDRESLYKQIMGHYQYLIFASFNKLLCRHTVWIMYSSFVISHLHFPVLEDDIKGLAFMSCLSKNMRRTCLFITEVYLQNVPMSRT